MVLHNQLYLAKQIGLILDEGQRNVLTFLADFDFNPCNRKLDQHSNGGDDNWSVNPTANNDNIMI